MDMIIIHDLEVFAHHGVLPEEKRDGQTFFLDIVLGLDLKRAGQTDALEDTVNYDAVCDAAADEMTANTYDLIERAAQAVSDRIFADFPQVEHLSITLRKPSAPVKQNIGYAAVCIHRERT